MLKQVVIMGMGLEFNQTLVCQIFQSHDKTVICDCISPMKTVIW